VKTKIIEASNNNQNWGKFLIGEFDSEWEHRSKIDERPLVSSRGWTRDHFWILDLQTGEGACFRPGGLAKADLHKHQIWVCPLFEPFLEWFYKQKFSDISELPDLVQLPNASFEMYGYRRLGNKK